MARKVRPQYSTVSYDKVSVNPEQVKRDRVAAARYRVTRAKPDGRQERLTITLLDEAGAPVGSRSVWAADPAFGVPRSVDELRQDISTEVLYLLDLRAREKELTTLIGDYPPNVLFE